MDNVSKMKNEKYECNYYSITNTNSFITKKLLFQIINNFAKNTARKYCNIIFSNSYKTHALFFEFEGNIMNVKRVLVRQANIKYLLSLCSIFI